MHTPSGHESLMFVGKKTVTSIILYVKQEGGGASQYSESFVWALSSSSRSFYSPWGVKRRFALEMSNPLRIFWSSKHDTGQTGFILFHSRGCCRKFNKSGNTNVPNDWSPWIVTAFLQPGGRTCTEPWCCSSFLLFIENNGEISAFLFVLSLFAYLTSRLFKSKQVAFNFVIFGLCYWLLLFNRWLVIEYIF